MVRAEECTGPVQEGKGSVEAGRPKAQAEGAGQGSGARCPLSAPPLALAGPGHLTLHDFYLCKLSICDINESHVEEARTLPGTKSVALHVEAKRMEMGRGRVREVL